MVDESPGTAGTPATVEPQATANDLEDEIAEAAEGEDRADDPGDEVATAERGEDVADFLVAEADKLKEFASLWDEEFDEEDDSPGRGERKDFEAQKREWAEQNARMEERLRDNSIALILPNWSPSQLELGDVPQIPEARECLCVLAECSKLAMDNFGVWSLNPARLKRFRFSVAQRERSGIADILLDSLDEDCSPLDSSVTGLPPVPAPYAEVVSTWLASLDSDCELFREEKWKAVKACLQKDLIDPVMKEAEETPDAVLRNQLVLLAISSSLAHTQLLSLAAAAAALSGSHGPTGPRGLPDEELKQLLRVVDRFGNLTKVIQSCRTKSKSKLARWGRGRRTSRLRRARSRCPRPRPRPNAPRRTRTRVGGSRRAKAAGVCQLRGPRRGDRVQT